MASSSFDSDSPIITALTVASAFPTPEDTERLSQAFAHVKSILTANPDPSPNPTWTRLNLGALQIVTVGSYGYGLHDSSSDLDITVVGSLNAPIFYRIAQLRTRIVGKEYGVKVSRFVDAKDASMLELEVISGEGKESKSVIVDLHYACAPNLVSRWNEVAELPSDDILLALPAGTRRKVNAYRDMAHILRTIPNKETFTLAYRFIRTWAKRRGLYSSRFGLLSGFHITILLLRLVKRHKQTTLPETSSTFQILTAFFNEYADFDWEKDEVTDPDMKLVNRRRTWTEPISILTPNYPHINVSANATKHSVYILQKEFARARDVLKVEGTESWNEILGVELQKTAFDMVKEYKTFIKIDVSFWGTSIGRGKNVVGWTESRIIHLLIEIQSYFPMFRVRLFPNRFTLPTTESSPPTELTAFYLLGVVNTDPAAASTSTTDPNNKRILENKFLLVLSRFVEAVQRNEKVYSPAESYVACSLIRSLPKEGIVLDTDAKWDFLGDAAANFDAEPVGGALADEDLDNHEEESPIEELKALTETHYDLTALPPKTSPLRPAHDVLNRLRWDQSFDVKDYVVGYDDRFLGKLEMGVESWSNEKTEEEWIPMHRVVYFKRISDGAVVWDRRIALDTVFGSGRGDFTPVILKEDEEEVEEVKVDLKEETEEAVVEVVETSVDQTKESD